MPSLRVLSIGLVVLVLTVVATASLANQTQTTRTSCLISQVTRDSAPPDPNADSGGAAQDWYINSDRTIWVSVPAGGWPAGGRVFSGGRPVDGRKTYWVRPAGTQLFITGRRLDAQAPALEAHVPCCYPTGFQTVALFFPTDGCWEVTATARDRVLKFVTQVRPSTAGR